MKSPIRYPGGKSRVTKALLNQFPKNIKSYCEPFVGGGSMLLAVREALPEIMCWAYDKDSELIDFWDAIQDYSEAHTLKRRVEAVHKLERADIKTLCNSWRELEYLAPHEYYILNRCSFSGTIRMGGLSPDLDRFTASQVSMLSHYWPILDCAYTSFSWLSFAESIRDHQGDPDCFFFLDPPYYGITGLYKHGAIDHLELKYALEVLPNKWLMSINDCPEIRKMYSGCNIRPLKFTYGMNNCSKEGKQKRATELLISNY